MIFSREFKSTFGKLIAWVIVLLILAGLLIALQPMMLDVNMKSVFDSFLSSLTLGLKALLGMDEKIDYTSVSQYAAFAYQYIAVLIVIFAMQLGANTLSKEQGLGNIEYIYSNPISRSEIVGQKLLSSIITYIIFLLFLGAGTFGIMKLLVKPVDMEVLLNLIKIFIGLLASGLVFMSIGLFISALSNTTLYTEAISVLFVFVNVIVVILGKIYGGVFGEIIQYSAIETFKPIKMLLGNINLIAVAVNICIFIVFLLLSYAVYNKKDLKF